MLYGSNCGFGSNTVSVSGSETSFSQSQEQTSSLRGKHQSHIKSRKIRKENWRPVPQFSLLNWEYLWHFSGQRKWTENNHTLALDLDQTKSITNKTTACLCPLIFLIRGLKTWRKHKLGRRVRLCKLNVFIKPFIRAIQPKCFRRRKKRGYLSLDSRTKCSCPLSCCVFTVVPGVW